MNPEEEANPLKKQLPVDATTKPTTESDPPMSKIWSSVREFVQNKPVLHALWTTGYFLAHPFRFTDQVIREDWSDKLKPFRYLVEAYILAQIAMLLVNPASLGLKEASAATKTNLTKTQQFLSKSFDQATAIVTILGAVTVLHFLLGAKRFTFAQSFSLFCYCNGGSTLVMSVALALLTRIPLPTGPNLLVLFVALAEFAIIPLGFFYLIAPIVRIYRQKWWKTLLVSCPLIT